MKMESQLADLAAWVQSTMTRPQRTSPPDPTQKLQTTTAPSLAVPSGSTQSSEHITVIYFFTHLILGGFIFAT